MLRLGAGRGLATLRGWLTLLGWLTLRGWLPLRLDLPWLLAALRVALVGMYPFSPCRFTAYGAGLP